MEPKQADDFWYEMDEYSERRPGESTEDHFQRLFRFGFIPLRNRTRAFITDVKKLVESLGKSQRWVHDWFDNIFYYRIQPCPLAWEILRKNFGEYVTVLEQNQHDWVFYQLELIPRALRGRPGYKRLNRA